MKYLIAIIVLSCLSINGFAQDGPMLINAPRELQPVDPAKSAWNSTINYSNKLILNKQQKQRWYRKTPKYPITKGDLVAEMTKDTETGLTTVRWNNGAVYVGEINYGEISGTGTMIYPDSSKYQGQWKDDRFHGVGSMVCADGSKYTGEWHLGKPHGQGTFINAEGVAFTGKFKDGEPHGKCIIQDTDGQLYKARWYYGKLRKRSIKPLEEKNTK